MYHTKTIVIVFIVILVGIKISDWFYCSSLKKKVFDMHAISAQEFLSWNPLLRKNDFPGCYVIMVYKRKPTDKMEYENIYIGQSIHVYQRVQQHLKGHGNRNVYQSWKNGREVYITFIYCNKKKLNVLEKRLIRIFHATDSFNVQKGGAKRR